MKNLLFVILAVCSMQHEKRIKLRFMNQYKELIPVYAYWNDYSKIPTKQENISFMRTIQGVSPQIVVTKRFVQLHIIQGEELMTMTFEPSGSGIVDIMLPTAKGKPKGKASQQELNSKNDQKRIVQ